MNKLNQKQINAELEKIATRTVDVIETLEVRNSDSLDFVELCVWDIRRLMDAAYKAGRNENK